MSVPRASGSVLSGARRSAVLVPVSAPVALFTLFTLFTSCGLLLAVLHLTGCDAEFLADAPIETCTEVGAQCVLPNGPLGVCERSTCMTGATEPCFACVSQH